MSHTKAEREMLAGLCRIEIKRWSKARDKQYMVDLMQLALSELTEGWQERAEVAESRLSSAAERAGNLLAGWMKAEAERDALRAQLAELAKQEPVAYRWEGVESGRLCYDGIKPLGVISQPLYTRPAPQAPVVVKQPKTFSYKGLTQVQFERDCLWVEAVKAAGGEVADE